MPKVGIVTDSTCDLEPQRLARLGVEMVPLTVHFGDEHFRDWVDLHPAEFYLRLTSAAKLPTTSQLAPAEFANAYSRLAQQGCDEIVVVTLSAALSGTYQSALLASADAAIPVRVVDGRSASQGTALIVLAALQARTAGGDAAAIEKRALQVADSSRLFFLLDTLDYLVKGGRAGKATGLAASLLNIKPVLEVNAEGSIEPFAKVRGRSQAITALAKHIAEDSQQRGRLRVALMHAFVQGEAEEIQAALENAGADIEIVSSGMIGAVIGTYTGPGAVGVAYYPIG
jgi:DegV family protein with EDD domain